MNADDRASVEWVPRLDDFALVGVADRHGTAHPAFDRGPDRCDYCGEPFPCERLRMAVELLERRGIDPTGPALPPSS